MDVLALPSTVVRFATSSSLIVIIALIACIVWKMGYPRPFWTHYTLDPDDVCATAVERILVAINTIKEAIEADPECSTIRRINSYFGNRMNTLVRLYDQCTSEMSHAEMVNTCVDQILRSSNQVSPQVAALIPEWNRVGSTEVYMSDLMTSDGTFSGKRAACAIADMRLVTMYVIPSIQSVHSVQTKSMTHTEIIKYHVASEFGNYHVRVTDAFRTGKSDNAKDRAKNMIEYMRTIGKNLMAR